MFGQKVFILPAFADVRTSLTPKDSDQAVALAVFLSFSFPRLALFWTLVYLVKHSSQKSICGCWIATGVLCRFLMFNRQRPADPHGWSLDHNPGHRATVLSGFISLFFFPIAGFTVVFLFFFLAVVSGSKKLFYKKVPWAGVNGCLISPKKEKCEKSKGNVGGKTSHAGWGRKERGDFFNGWEQM